LKLSREILGREKFVAGEKKKNRMVVWGIIGGANEDPESLFG